VDITAELTYPLRLPKCLSCLSFVTSLYFNTTFFQNFFDLIIIILLQSLYLLQYLEEMKPGTVFQWWFFLTAFVFVDMGM